MMKSGFTDYLTKPVTLNDMEQMLLKYLPEGKVEKSEAAVQAADQEEEQVPEAISSIEGIDAGSGIQYCGDLEEYLEALRIYADSVESKAMRIREFLAESDTEAFCLTIHSLKSTSNAIGAKELSAKAIELEALGKSYDVETLKEEADRFLKEYEDLGRALNAALEQIDQD